MLLYFTEIVFFLVFGTLIVFKSGYSPGSDMRAGNIFSLKKTAVKNINFWLWNARYSATFLVNLDVVFDESSLFNPHCCYVVYEEDDNNVFSIISADALMCR